MRIDIRIAYYFIYILKLYTARYQKKVQLRNDAKWKSYFKQDSKFQFKINENLVIHHYQDSLLSREIFDGFEEDELLFIKKFLRESDYFLDVGANIGFYSLHAAQIVGLEGKVFAFEPTPKTFSRLLENVRINKFENTISCHNIGLSENKGILKLNVSTDGHDAWNTFASPTYDYFTNQIDIPVNTLDDVLISNNIDVKKISLIKVDVEGWEVFVFRGAENFLKAEDSPALLVEFTEEFAFSAGTSCHELYDLIKSYGYNWYTYDSKQNQLIPEKKRLHYPYNNLIALKDVQKARMRLSGQSDTTLT
jgi:FkbM family methyltransferase